MNATTTKVLTPVAVAWGANEDLGKNIAQAAKARVLESRSTATAAQLKKALELLRIRQRHTYEFRACGISHPAARVKDLVARGFVITSSRITTVDAEAFEHRNVALYELVSEPKGGL